MLKLRNKGKEYKTFTRIADIYQAPKCMHQFNHLKQEETGVPVVIYMETEQKSRLQQTQAKNKCNPCVELNPNYDEMQC